MPAVCMLGCSQPMKLQLRRLHPRNLVRSVYCCCLHATSWNFQYHLGNRHVLPVSYLMQKECLTVAPASKQSDSKQTLFIRYSMESCRCLLRIHLHEAPTAARCLPLSVFLREGPQGTNSAPTTQSQTLLLPPLLTNRILDAESLQCHHDAVLQKGSGQSEAP